MPELPTTDTLAALYRRLIARIDELEADLTAINSTIVILERIVLNDQ